MIDTLHSALRGLPVLLADVGIMGPGTAPVVPVDTIPITAVPIGDAAPPPPEMGLFGGWGMFIWIGIMVVFMYFFMLRPQKKREKKMKEMQAGLATGDYVITNAGLFGRIAAVGDDCFVVEFGTNRSIRIPVLKSEVVGIREPKMTPQIIDAPAGKDEKDA
ncbi:MAG: preprotein translocase subunit YajC [Defluviitaleaceae bacterium]|nr:preprotein translocase subunit YajC [Defluviitaleaceae bacterium]MCL2276192.1 preprotein translocase subunit YajC [Defluviitaleaceae bacterium]